MKLALIITALTFSWVCSANPIMRMSSKKRAPLQGKVKIVRSSGYGGVYPAGARTFNQDNYSVDSYSNAGLILHSRRVENGMITIWTEYKYDSKGNKIEECTFGEDLEVSQCRAFTYDTLGNLVEERTYFSRDDIATTKYTYRGKQLMSKWSSVEDIIYRYNISGQLIAEEQNDKGEGKIVTKYGYDSNGRILSETVVFGTGFICTTGYTYDKHNNEILAEESFNGESGRRFITEYIYDSQGNWISCIEDWPEYNSTGTDEKSASLREIEYY